jgi:hypothetical protein
LILFNVMLPLFFGNSIYEATIPLSVTYIMSQCEFLTKALNPAKIRLFVYIYTHFVLDVYP